ncbi:general substrate transporter [Dipodascopsis tothii]|uniref:general substrate transporter n=1 Tax=Dipodascopsis tothii TaxID=44089 RepID=UPI0034CD0387
MENHEEKPSKDIVAESLTTSEDLAAVNLADQPGGFKGLLAASNIFWLSLFAALGGFLFGYDQGVISGVLVMEAFQLKFPRLGSDGDLEGWVVSVMQLGAIIGSVVNGPLADKISRRHSMSIANLIMVVGAVLQAAAVNPAMMFIGRFIGGISLGMLSMVVPMWIGEIAPPSIRGSAVTLQQLAISFGIMVSFWLDYGMQHGTSGAIQWRVPLALRVVPAVVMIIGSFLFMPYSPRWLVNVGRETQALEVLIKLRRLPADHPLIQEEMLQIKAASAFDKATTALKFPDARTSGQKQWNQIKELFSQKHLRKRLFVACALQVLQQFTGVNAIIYYAPKMFKAIGLSGSSISLLATGVVGVVNFLATIPAVGLVDGFGRKSVLLVGSASMAGCHLIIATLYAVYEHTWAEHAAAGWAAAAFVWFFVLHFAYSIGCIAWVYPSEIFPPGVRSTAMGLSIAVNWLSNFVIGLVTPYMLTGIRYGTFYFFFAFTAILFAWVLLCLPETKGVAMEDMDRLWGGNDGKEDAERMEKIIKDLRSEGPMGVTAKGAFDEQIETVSAGGIELGKIHDA